MRAILAIEISNPSAAGADGSPPRPGVALGELAPNGVRTLGAEPLRAGSRHDDDLMPAIDRLFRAHGAVPSDLSRVAVSAGPGGFTGLRVAVTTAKALAEATGAETVAVPTALVAGRAHAGRTLVCLASKRGETCAQLVVDGGLDGPLSVIDAQGLDAFGADRLLSDPALPGPIRARTGELGIATAPLRLDPLVCLELGARLEPVDPITLAPIYAREPEAVRKWREIHG